MANDGQSIRILTVNSGSSSLKFALIQAKPDESLVLSGRMDRIGLGGGALQVRLADGTLSIDRPLESANHDAAFRSLFAWMQDEPAGRSFEAVGHRIVHGGLTHVQPTLVTAELIASLQRLVPLAPEHLPHELKAIEAVRRSHPAVPQVACFDTAFHRHMPPVARFFALPRHLRDEGVVRYGFHGLSYEYIMGELRTGGARAADGRVIIAHLGNGASMAAVRGGTASTPQWG